MTGHVIGRLAPSPTGAQHVGNARTYLLAWLLCRREQDNRMLLRIEDLETPRVKSCAVNQIFEDFQWLGIDWDVDLQSESTGYVIQSTRVPRYREVLEELANRELIYPCTCSRSDVSSASAAPHESTLDGQVYPGTCRHRTAQDRMRLRDQGIPFSLRFRTSDVIATWYDGLLGQQSCQVQSALGDFVVWRSDDTPAYQLAVVIDDHDSHVNQVVRGADLVYSTFRQLAIMQALDWIPPNYVQVPLVIGSDGKRLAKRHGDTRLSTLRDEGIQANQLIGYLAWKSGMIPTPKRCSARDLIGVDPLLNLPREPLVFDRESDIPLMKQIR
jgi:glutamyl-tRNA synthetase